MSERKRKRKGEREYVCHDCVATFSLWPPPGTTRIYCPLCADHIAVTLAKKVKPMHKRWSKEETKIIDKFIAGKITVYDIMRKTGRNEKSIRMKVNRRKVSLGNANVRGNWSEEENNMILRCIRKEITDREAAEILGRTYDQVKSRKNYFKRKGIS